MLNDERRALGRFIESAEASYRAAAERFLARKRSRETSREGYGNQSEGSKAEASPDSPDRQPETPQCDGERATAFLEGVAALRSLGCQKHEAEVLMRRAMYENVDAPVEVLLAAALRLRQRR